MFNRDIEKVNRSAYDEKPYNYSDYDKARIIQEHIADLKLDDMACYHCKRLAYCERANSSRKMCSFAVY
jgi:hypothetical protein